MAFWGVEVRPGKPFTHTHDEARGRLRVSQVTLGMGKGTAKSVLQCNIGKKSPILICSLIPDHSESCHLELEFEEAEDVVFSVIGQRSVHMAGYYIGSGRGRGGDDSDSYGEDLGEEDSEIDGSFDNDDEDEYESDFIDDSDIGMFPPSPKCKKSAVVIEEIVDDDKPANGNGRRRRLKKKNQLSDTDDGEDDACDLAARAKSSLVIESEDEDDFPITKSLKNKNAVKNTEENKSGEKVVDEDRKRKIDATTKNVQSERETLPTDTATNDTSKKKKKVSKGNPLETTSVPAMEQDIDATGIEVQTTEKNEKSKKKKKEKVKKGKTQEDTEDAMPADDMGRDSDEIKVGSNEKLKKKKKKGNHDLDEGMSSCKNVEEGKDAELDGSLAKNELTMLGSNDANSAEPESKKKRKNKGKKT